MFDSSCFVYVCLRIYMYVMSLHLQHLYIQASCLDWIRMPTMPTHANIACCASTTMGTTWSTMSNGVAGTSMGSETLRRTVPRGSNCPRRTFRRRRRRQTQNNKKRKTETEPKQQEGEGQGEAEGEEEEEEGRRPKKNNRKHKNN